MSYGHLTQRVSVKRGILLVKVSFYLGTAPIGGGAQMMGNQLEREHRRFHLGFPVCVKFRAANCATEVEAISQNVSIGGLLVKSLSLIPEQTRVAFIISVQEEWAGRPIYLEGEGEVVRVERSGAAFAVAIKCKTPISQLDDCLANV